MLDTRNIVDPSLLQKSLSMNITVAYISEKRYNKHNVIQPSYDGSMQVVRLSYYN